MRNPARLSHEERSPDVLLRQLIVPPNKFTIVVPTGLTVIYLRVTLQKKAVMNSNNDEVM